MRKIMIFYALIYMTTADQGYDYKPQLENPALNNLEQQSYLKTTKETEYLVYTAPDDENDIEDAKRLAGLIQPQRVIFIKNPENKIFSLTAEQLAKQQSLNIYVFQHHIDSAALQSQLKDIRDRIGQKPHVQFIKYRTTDDIEKAKQAIYHDFESIPGTSKYHQNHQTPVYEFDTRSQQLHSVHKEHTTQTPVIFEILKRPTSAPTVQVDSPESISIEKNENDEKSSQTSLNYLPSALN